MKPSRATVSALEVLSVQLRLESTNLRLTAEQLVGASRCKHNYLYALKTDYRVNWGDSGGDPLVALYLFWRPLGLAMHLGNARRGQIPYTIVEAGPNAACVHAHQRRFLMSLWDKLTGRTQKPNSTSNAELSPETERSIAEALDLMKLHVAFSDKGVYVASAGSEGKLMDVARAFELAHDRYPAKPMLHYAWASALDLAAQFKTAKAEMARLAEAHPDFLPARFALDGWDRWESPFRLPEWSPRTSSALPVVSRKVQSAVLLPVRDGYTPRAALFLRDKAGDFRDLEVLKSAKIDITTVISDITNPQIVAINARIWDDPTNPYPLEALDFPLCQRGLTDRRKYEYLCLQEDIDFAIIDARDRLLLNKRLQIPPRMREVNQRLLKLLVGSDGIEIPLDKAGGDRWYDTVGRPAIKAHQSRLQPSDVRY